MCIKKLHFGIYLYQYICVQLLLKYIYIYKYYISLVYYILLQAQRL